MTSDDTRVWFITGASSGLGRALAETALDRGERVVATARDPERVAELADRHPDRAAAVRLDVTDPEQARAAVEKGLAAFERIDVVVNPENGDYGESVGKAFEWFEDIAGQQPNDPARRGDHRGGRRRRAPAPAAARRGGGRGDSREARRPAP